MSISNLAFQGNGDIAATHYLDQNPGQHYQVTGRLAIINAGIGGTVRLRFAWQDPDLGNIVKDISISVLAGASAPVDFTFPVHSVDYAWVTYQIDRLALIGTVVWNFNCDANYL